MATISNIVVEISAKTQKLQQGIKKATSMVGRFAKSVAKIGGIVTGIVGGVMVTAFALLTKSITNTANELDATIKTASNLGIAVSSLQRLQFQAEQSGIGSEQLTRSMQQLVRVAGEAGQGSKRAAQAFETLGISLREVRNMKPDELFLLIGKRLESLQSQTEQAATANVLFGRNWLSVLNLVRSDLDATAAQFDKLGLAITDQQGKSIEAFNDARNRLSKIWDSFFVQLTAQTAGAFTTLLSWIEKAIIDFGGMQKAATVATGFIVDGIGFVISAFQRLQLIVNDIQIGLKRLEIAGLKLRTFGQALKATYGGIFIDTENEAGVAAASAVLAAEKELDKLFRNESRIKNSPLAKGLRELKKEIESPQSFIQPIGDLFGGSNGIGAAVQADKVKKITDEQDKATKNAIKYKAEIKKANSELTKSSQLVRQLQQRQQEAAMGGGTFATNITALSNILSRANDPNRDVFERSAQQRLFDRSRLQLAGMGVDGRRSQQQQKLEVTITTDEAGIISPVVKSQQLDEKVVSVVTRTVNQQARINDR